MKAMIFDVDNTLYDVKQYFSGAFAAISEYLSSKYNISKNDLYGRLLKLWEEKTSMYPHLLDDLVRAFNIDENEVRAIVKIFNEHNEKLKPYSDVIPTLQELKKRRYQLGIITDGDVKRQKRKIESLGLKHFFDVIIYSKKINPKPSSSPYLKALEELGIKPSDAFYVADNPLVDFEGAKKIGMATVRILRGEFKKLPKNDYIDYEVTEIKKLLKVLDNG